MKKKWFSLLLSCLLLASCGNGDPQRVIQESRSAVDALAVPSAAAKYSLTVSGHIVQFSEFRKPSASYPVPEGALDSFGSSYLLHLPVRLTKENYYPTAEDVDPVSYTYGALRSVLQGTTDDIHFMDFHKEDTDLVFSNSKFSGLVNFYNVVVPNGTASKPISNYGRYNIRITYNNKGLLLREEVKTVNAGKDADEVTVDVAAEYTYTAA